MKSDSATTVILLFLLMGSSLISGQSGFKGRITDEKGYGIPLANVVIDDLKKGVSSDLDGYFEMMIENGDYEVSISSVGFESKVFIVSVRNDMLNLGIIQLKIATQIMDEVVVSGSRTIEKITESPATIDLITAPQLENHVGSPEELFALQKGVDFTRIGNFWGSISIRGFNSAFNQKMLILDDNRIAHLRIRTPVGPMSAFVKEDVERVEIVLGPSSALYGPNSLNGLFYTVSKSPFTYPGTEIVLGAGSNQLLSARFRHALKINEKWAYKITGEYISGEEDKFTDSVYIPTGVPVNYVGKAEVGLDRDVEFIKSLIAAFYKPTPETEFGINYAFNRNTSVSNGSRNNLRNWDNSSLQATYNAPHWFAQIYKTWIVLDKSINTSVRTSNYYNLLSQGQSEEAAFTNSLNGPRKTTLEEDSYRLNGEVQYNNTWRNFNLVVGSQYQKEHAYSNHTYLLDADGPIKLYQLGVYGQIMSDLTDTGIKFIFAARGDDHSLFGFNFVPKAGITYTKNEGTWRLTYGKGYTAPTLINTNQNGSGGTVLGNGEGFTLSDGTKIKPIGPETVKTIEIGYKSILFKGKLFLDADAYYNWSEDQISPIINIAPTGRTGGPVVTHRGNRPITDFTQGLAPGVLDPGAAIFTNVNFGEAQTYGFDLGLNYYFSDHYNLTLNYSYFDYNLDRNDLTNDANQDGKVTDNDLSINTPKNKISSAFNARYNKFYGTIFARWVQEYDFFSGRSVAAATNPENIYNGSPVIESQRVGTQWNYGPLGGFYLSLNGNYQITKMFNIGLYINNLIGEDNFEFVAVAPTETTYGVELKLSLF